MDARVADAVKQLRHLAVPGAGSHLLGFAVTTPRTFDSQVGVTISRQTGLKDSQESHAVCCRHVRSKFAVVLSSRIDEYCCLLLALLIAHRSWLVACWFVAAKPSPRSQRQHLFMLGTCTDPFSGSECFWPCLDKKHPLWCSPASAVCRWQEQKIIELLFAICTTCWCVDDETTKHEHTDTNPAKALGCGGTGAFNCRATNAACKQTKENKEHSTWLPFLLFLFYKLDLSAEAVAATLHRSENIGSGNSTTPRGIAMPSSPSAEA